jgi:hypothetical protein
MIAGSEIRRTLALRIHSVFCVGAALLERVSPFVCALSLWEKAG